MYDNPNLDPGYVDAMKKAFTGLWYKRFILGLWVMAAGVVYDVFKDDKHKIDKLPDTFDKYYITMDYGTNNPCVFLLIGKKDNKYYVIKEFYHEGRKEGQKTGPESWLFTPGRNGRSGRNKYGCTIGNRDHCQRNR